jgi:hypothetical protein
MGMMKLQKKSWYPDAKSVKEESMAVSLFSGLLGGAILGFATQNGRSRLCELIRVRYPVLFKSIGLLLLAVAVILPTLSLIGMVNVNMTSFFWGGCLALNFIIGFFVTHCEIMQKWQEVS